MANRENDAREHNQNRNNEGTSSRNFLVGAVIGGVVGAAAALLLAPKTGKEFRNDLNNQVNNILEKTNPLSDNVVEKSNELAALTKEKAAALSNTVIRQSKDLVKKVKSLSTNEEVPEEDDETVYISLNDSPVKEDSKKSSSGIQTEVDVRKKLEEAQKAFDQEENKIKQ